MNEQQYWDWRALLATLMRGGAYGYYWRAEGKLSKWFDAQNPPETPTGPYNYYFGIHPVTAIPTHSSKGQLAKPENVRSQIAVIAAINCLFAEFDAPDFDDGKPGAMAHVEALPLPPTVIVDSGGGYHCYWLLWEEISINSQAGREYMDSVQKRWVDFVGSDGGAKDMARVLRIPGTFNRKPEHAPDFPEVTLTRVEWEACYNLAELINLLPPAQSKKQKQMTRPSSSAAPDDAKLLDFARNARNGAKFSALFDRGDIASYKSQSEADAALCSILNFWTRNDAARTDRLFRQSALYRPEKWDSVRVQGATYGEATTARMQ